VTECAPTGRAHYLVFSNWISAMALTLYYHPLSSYCQKAETAFYEKGLEFNGKLLDGSEPVHSEFRALWPIGKFPLRVDGERMVFEATAIIEYLDILAPGTERLIPDDPLDAAQARMWDRFFDNYVGYPQGSAARPMMGVRGGKRRSTRPMRFSTGTWRPANGRRRIASAWPIARPPRIFSTQTGRIRSASSSVI